MFYDRFRLAYKSLKERKARSFLSLLGIAVGIAAIVSLLAVGGGMEHMVVGGLAPFADRISVMSGTMGPMGFVPLGAFTERDIEDITGIEGVREVIPIMSGFVAVEHRGQRIPIGIWGSDPDAMADPDRTELREGRWLREDDYQAAVIGYDVAEAFFEHAIGLNDRIVIEGTNFVVVGILERVGGILGVDVDPSIFLTMRCAQQVLGTDEITLLSLRVYDVTRAEEIATEIRETIDANHGLEGFAFTSTMVALIEGIEMVSMVIQAFLVGIAAIALFVAGIGIMNSMLMSVMERTREIGIMKAIGASDSNILSQFLLEAGAISLLGGILGCLVGAGIAAVVSFGITEYVGAEMPAMVTLPVLTGGVLIAIVVGVLSGLYPARRAMKMNPVEAMRRE